MTVPVWTKRDVSGSSSNLIAIACSSDADKYVVADQAGGASLWGSTNSGADWSAFSGVTGQWNNVVCSSNRQVILAIDAAGNVSVSTNGGTGWTTTAWTASINLPYQVAISGDGTKMLICTNIASDYLYTSSDGITWAAATGPGLQQWNSVSISRDGSTQAACWTDFATEGHILKTGDGWATSSDVSPDTTIFWTYVKLGGTGAVAAALTTDGTSFYWTVNSFASWSSSTGTLVYASGSATLAISDNGTVALIATGSTGITAQMSFDSGATWATPILPGSDDLTRCYSACISSDGTAGAVCDYPSDGTVWTFAPPPPPPPMPPLRERTYRRRFLGLGFDPHVVIVKDRPGPLRIIEFIAEMN